MRSPTPLLAYHLKDLAACLSRVRTSKPFEGNDELGDAIDLIIP
jgi:hypothetical protein